MWASWALAKWALDTQAEFLGFRLQIALNKLAFEIQIEHIAYINSELKYFLVRFFPHILRSRVIAIGHQNVYTLSKLETNQNGYLGPQKPHPAPFSQTHVVLLILPF